MPPSNKLPPGPVGTSCLTCRRRSNGYTYDEPLPSDQVKQADSRSGLSGSSTSSSSFLGDASPRSDETSISDNIRGGGTARLTQSGTAHTRQDVPNPLALYKDDAVVYDTFPPTRSKTRVTDNELPLPLASVNAAITKRPVFPTSPLLFELASRVPKSVPTPPDVRDITEYVISRFDLMFSLTYFKPRDEQIKKFHVELFWRLSICNFARQDARIHDSALEGSLSTHINQFTRWIEGFERSVRARLDEPLSAYELQDRLGDILEIFFAKGRLLNGAATYKLFCGMVPNFLQMVYSDPTLWPTHSGPTLISVAHLLASSRYGPPCYALMDVQGSMIYGVPQLVDYNTDIDLFHVEPHPVEWADCFPGEFLVLLAKINACRDQRSADNWQEIEQRLVSWQPRPRFDPKGLESWKLVAWKALQETWRHTLLMYLYLAVCGVPTDDPRIQTSLRQIFQLMGVIRRQDPPVSNVHVFSQCLIAGICSRTEKQRRLVRERLGCEAETRFWMFRGPEIVPVLDHLWLGAGIEGRPVTWGDYMHSRQTVLPLFI